MLAQSTNSDATATIPARPAAEFSRTLEKSPRRHVLVVDDEALVRWSVAETLGACGYEVAEAGDAQSAIRAFTNSDGRVADLVLLDLRLPDCDDLRVLSAMRRLSPATPVILMTAFGTPELLNEAAALGAFTTVNKPFEMGDLASLVERALAARPS